MATVETTTEEIKAPAKKAEHYYPGVGRRKAAVATVRMTSGKGKITVNDQSLEQYTNNQTLATIIEQPLALVGKQKDLDINVRVSGGGKRGQVDAIQLAIARALNELSPDFHATLRKAGFLTRDARVKERKKYGLKKARKAPQFSKR